MSIIKISVFIRSQNVVWNYKKEKSSDFWDDVASNLDASLCGITFISQPQGSFLRNIYINGDRDTDFYKKLIFDIISRLLSEDDAKMVIVSLSSPSLGELENLKKLSVGKIEDEGFFKQIDKQIETDKSSQPVNGGDEIPVKNEALKEKEIHDMPAEANKSNGDDNKAENEKNTDEKPETLLSRAEKIKTLKEGLLKKIRGQRHAVDEVVQSIFECEMFSSLNPNRKGPLATFLFTGPSGVGKTFLAETCGKLLGRKMLIVDMSEYSDNLANGKFNGNHGQAAVVTSFVRNNPDGIIIFDEVEKAHINTIHLFLQILDAARLMDHQIKKEVSFKDNIIIMTTNAGKELYDDATVCDLSQTPRSVIIEALRTDINNMTGQPFFPECITTRMANGHVILFNHLEPYALMEIVRDEIDLQIGLFEKASGVKVEYNGDMLAALVLYNGGGVADARTLRGLARNIIVRELQEMVMQLFAKAPSDVDKLESITISIDTEENDEISNLFVNREKMHVALFTDRIANEKDLENCIENTQFEVFNDADSFKRRIRGVTDYVMIDPLCGAVSREKTPSDIEDVDSQGMRIFEYMREFSPEIPVYILDTFPSDQSCSYDTLLARGAKGLIKYDGDNMENFINALEKLSFNALINNSVYSLGRTGKYLTFNCAQYIAAPERAVVSFEKFRLKRAYGAADSSSIAKKGENNNIKLKDVIGCRGAKNALAEYCKMLDNPRETMLNGKRMPKGVLLYGPPGTGKTMLAKAMANECNATFIPVSATSFFGSLVGETEKNIRELFKRARKYAPAIVFVDEVDAIGRLRVGSPSTAHNEDALNAFLTEMDGFATDDKRPVFILAATNYDISGDSGRVLDGAFVRRFDDRILVSLPDRDDRYEYLELSLKKHGINFGANHEQILKNMAERTGGMSCADLEKMNCQYIRTLGNEAPDGAKYMDAIDAFRFGEVNKMNSSHLRQTACHEAGHALVCRLCGTTPSFLTVVSRGGYGGFMESAGENDEGTFTFDKLMDLVCRCLAGRVAEIELYGNSLGINTGASSDIQKARYYIKASLNDFAMGDKLYLTSDDNEGEKLMQLQYERTQKMLREHKNTLEKLTDLLTKKKSLDKNEMEKFFTEENI